MSDPFKRLIGETIVSVHGTPGDDRIGFLAASGKTYLFEAEGDCCSYSWFNHISGLYHLIGNEIAGVIDRPMDDADEADNGGRSVDCIQVYGWTIVTTKGYFDIEMRNDSNGYYGGSVYGPVRFNTNEIPEIKADF